MYFRPWQPTKERRSKSMAAESNTYTYAAQGKQERRVLQWRSWKEN
jgi:hypothetical protein